ncbi:hypothetical protein TELCIR_00045 [Teladorsagia circumcincta]|uniref:Preprotein translocase subunit SecG domain protein n=1 Tax=Teladorsagia circumcincta TaxID=45464 RepID=A0A2G9V5J0_TELCI|nr:hypothetical protein TELCIR_00045 [Teladorsagia circumcincta]
MRNLLLLLSVAGVSLANFASQSSGYEVAEQIQPAPAPVSANGVPPPAPAPAAGGTYPVAPPEPAPAVELVAEPEGNEIGGYRARRRRFRVVRRKVHRKHH